MDVSIAAPASSPLAVSAVSTATYSTVAAVTIDPPTSTPSAPSSERQVEVTSTGAAQAMISDALSSLVLSLTTVITLSGTTYSPLSSDLGVQVAVHGQTSTIKTPSATRTDLVTVGGTTYSLTLSGSGVRVAADGQTTTVDKSLPDAPNLLKLGTRLVSYDVDSSLGFVEGSTLSIGGPAMTLEGKTLSLASQGSSIAIVVDGTTTQALQIATATEEVFTFDGQTITAAAGTGGIIVNGETVSSGIAAIFNGETISVAGTNLVVASESMTTTQGLGDAIINGLNPAHTRSMQASAYHGVGSSAQYPSGLVITAIAVLLALSRIVLL